VRAVMAFDEEGEHLLSWC